MALETFDVVWARRNRFGSYFPALEIPSSKVPQIWKIVKNAFSFCRNAQIDPMQTLIQCSSCSWILGHDRFFHCNKHKNFFCFRCFRLMKRSIIPVAPKLPNMSKNNQNKKQVHDPLRRSSISRTIRKDLIDLPVSNEHIKFFSKLANPFSENIQGESKYKNIGSFAKYLQTQKIFERSDDDEPGFIKEETKLVFWLDGTSSFSFVPTDKILDFMDNFQTFGNKQKQPLLDETSFRLLRKSVGHAMSLLGKSDIRCNVLVGDQTPKTENTSVNYEDCYDNTCLRCGEVGDLICCDGCTRVFHLSCAKMFKVPDGVWLCDYCELNSLDRNVTFDLEEDLLTAKETLNLAKTRTSDDEVKTENKHKYELRSAEKKSGNLVKSLLDKKLTKSQKFDGPANWMKTTIRYSFLPETNFVRSNQKGAFSITKNDGLMVDEIGFGFSFKISESNLFSENKTEKNEKKLIQNMDKFAIELLNPKSAINYFLNQNFKREFGYLLQVPIEWRFPEIDPKTGKGGYVDSYEALGFYRKATFTEKSDRHIWFIDKVPLLKTQNFLQHQKTLLEKNKEFQNFFQIGKNEKIGKNKFKRAKNKYIWKRDRSNNDSLDQKKFENKKFTKSRFKSIPKKRIKKQMLSKKLSDIEKDNLLYETVLTAYSKEKYGNSMKLRSIEAKENEILKKLKEAKLQINIKSVENCENLKQIYFYKNKIKQLKKEILKIDNNHQINKIMENLSEELKTKSSTFQKNRKQEKWLKETELCQEHKQKLKEQNKMNNKRLCRIGEKVGTKICNGTAFVAVSWRDNDFCKEEVSWEHFDCCP